MFAHLLRSIRPSRHDDAHRQPHDPQHLNRAILFAHVPAHHQCDHAAKAAQDNVHRYGYVERKRPIIEHVDQAEEEGGIDEADQRYLRKAYAVGKEDIDEG